jgi:hypothetical protein
VEDAAISNIQSISRFDCARKTFGPHCTPLFPVQKRENIINHTLTGRNTFLISRIGLRTLGTEINEREVAKVPVAVHLLVTAAQLQQTEVCVCLLSLSLSLSTPAKSLT